MSVETCSDALQAVERLYIQLKKDKDQHSENVLEKCTLTLDNLRAIKSEVEGSEVNISAPVFDESFMIELRQLTLMHIPSSLTDDVRVKITSLVKKSTADEDIEIVYAVLVTCAWYSSTQRERGEQAKYNQLYVVYKSTMENYMAPVNTHIQDQCNVVDKGWLYAIELNYFVQFLAKGRTRNVEVLYCPLEAVLYQTPDWEELRTKLNYLKVLGMRCCIEACRGQAINGIGKKGKDGKFRMKDAVTFAELCDSFRLIHHAHNFTRGLPPCTSELTDVENLPDIAVKAKDLLYSMYQNPDLSKKDVFPLLCEWREMVDHNIKSFEFTNPEEVQSILGNWFMDVRLGGKKITPQICPKDDHSSLMELMESIGGPVCELKPEQILLITRAGPKDDHSTLVELMESIGGPVCELKPEQILLITRAGSYMYGLSTATSDTDYVIVYAETTEKIMTACKRLPEIVENRGPQQQIEYGAYEVRCFAEMLLKGSVVILELVYKSDHNYMSPAWKALSRNSANFISERAIQQYMGLIKNNFKMIENGKHKDQPQERKLFYQIYHKLESLEYMLNGLSPPVKCTGPVRDFIMRVRTSPLEGDLHRDLLYQDAKYKFDKLRDNLSSRKQRLRENCDYEFLLDWLLTVRGINTV